MNTEAISAADQERIFREEIRLETSLSLATDLLERGLQGLMDDLYMTLIHIIDSELILKDQLLRKRIAELCEKAEELCDQLHAAFPSSKGGRANALRKLKCSTLTQEVDFYRQEQFWTKHDRQSLLKAEDLITELFRFYSQVEWEMLEIDATQPLHRRAQRRYRVPKHTVNPYETIVGEVNQDNP